MFIPLKLIVMGFDTLPYLNGDIAIRKESSIPIISTCMWLKRCLTGRLGWSQAELLKTGACRAEKICCILLNSHYNSLLSYLHKHIWQALPALTAKVEAAATKLPIFIRQNWSLSGASFPLVPPSFPAPWHILTQSPTMSDLSQQSFNAQSQTQALPPCGPAGNTDKHSRNQPSYISLLLYILLSDCQWILGAPSSKTWGIKGGPSTQVDRSMVQIKPTSRIENWTSRSGLLIGMVELKPVAHSCQFWAVFGMHVEIRWNIICVSYYVPQNQGSGWLSVNFASRSKVLIFCFCSTWWVHHNPLSSLCHEVRVPSKISWQILAMCFLKMGQDCQQPCDYGQIPSTSCKSTKTVILLNMSKP